MNITLVGTITEARPLDPQCSTWKYTFEDSDGEQQPLEFDLYNHNVLPTGPCVITITPASRRQRP